MSFVILEWHPSLRSVTLAAIDSPPVRASVVQHFSPRSFARSRVQRRYIAPTKIFGCTWKLYDALGFTSCAKRAGRVGAQNPDNRTECHFIRWHSDVEANWIKWDKRWQEGLFVLIWLESDVPNKISEFSFYFVFVWRQFCIDKMVIISLVFWLKKLKQLS